MVSIVTIMLYPCEVKGDILFSVWILFESAWHWHECTITLEQVGRFSLNLK